LAKTDVVDAVAAARALLAEPTLGPAQALEIYDPLVAKIEAVLEHRRALVEARTLMPHYAQDQLTKLPSEIRDQLPTTGRIESRLRNLATVDTNVVSTDAGAYRLSWLIPLIDQDRAARRQIRQLERDLDDLLDTPGTTLRDEPGVGPIAAATLLVEVGDPFRFARESKFARWSGTGAVALSSAEGDGLPVRHRLDFGGNRRINSVLYIASVTQQRDQAAARTYIDHKTTEGKPAEKPTGPTSATSPTASSAECGPTNDDERQPYPSQLDKGASDSPFCTGIWRARGARFDAICGEVRHRAVRVRPGAPMPLSVRLWGLLYVGQRFAVRGDDGLGFANLHDVEVEHELGIVGCRCDDDAGEVAVPVEGDQQVDANG
jgi:Transposase IS116/IS110/IS902 family